MNPKHLLCAIALTGLAVTATPAAADPPMSSHWRPNPKYCNDSGVA
ncbi:hypothetical protein [Nocardia sp. NBC_00511]